MKRARALAVAAAAALIAGCGGGEGGPAEATPEQREQIEATIADYQAALDDGDGEAGCATLAPAQVEQAGGAKECASFFEAAAKEGAGELPGTESGAPVERIDIADTGELARVYYEGEEAFTRLLLIDGDWYLSTTAESAPAP